MTGRADMIEWKRELKNLKRDLATAIRTNSYRVSTLQNLIFHLENKIKLNKG